MSDISTSLISGLSSVTNSLTNSSSASGTNPTKSFASILSDAISLTEDTNTNSNAEMLNLLTGNSNDLSSTLITTEKAELALNLTVAIRNKAVDAYKEIMNMQV